MHWVLLWAVVSKKYYLKEELFFRSAVLDSPPVRVVAWEPDSSV